MLRNAHERQKAKSEGRSMTEIGTSARD
jgi:hypothetical protein